MSRHFEIINNIVISFISNYSDVLYYLLMKFLNLIIYLRARVNLSPFIALLQLSLFRLIIQFNHIYMFNQLIESTSKVKFFNVLLKLTIMK